MSDFNENQDLLLGTVSDQPEKSNFHQELAFRLLEGYFPIF